VTAGVYLLIRINLIIIEMNISYLLLLIGIITIIIAGITAIIEIDIKKIIALSTLRQLGIIILILGLGNPILSFFHLLSHAFFKAILFMCAGMIIHNIKDYQDIRKIGMGYSNLNFCISIILIANISLCGLPFLRGFYSKDLIIEILIIKGKNIFPFFFRMTKPLFFKKKNMTRLSCTRRHLLSSLPLVDRSRLHHLRLSSSYLGCDLLTALLQAELDAADEQKTFYWDTSVSVPAGQAAPGLFDAMQQKGSPQGQLSTTGK